eukprot:m.157528 g.157528  ORF g.157528 m.157528 type:complete len:345 (+) comp38710_c0_seq8:74-1108(+)
MDFLKAEIERKRKQLRENEAVRTKKYVKRSELELLDQAGETGNPGVDATSPTDLLSPTKGKYLIDEPSDEELTMPRSEVVKRLRERAEPIRLYGESDVEACRRLRQIEIQAPEIVKGLRNDLKDEMDKIDEEYLEGVIRSQGGDGGEEKKPTNDVQITEDGTTLDDIIEFAKGLGKGDNNHDHGVIAKFLKLLINEWGKELNSRQETTKRSVQGKLALATYKQTVSYLKPLSRMLKKRSVPGDILNFLIVIIGSLLERNYVQASDSYLRMAIGNAPWPIGVTMVGIHARTGREKIFAQNVAHVLNDETQRKYIQALKRLMTFCQKIYPTDPSRCVEYNAQSFPS